ncbi:MAG: fumarylacetoacetate hydrolase family protein [Nitrososphaerota archaeon]|jgi:2-keto-4-pentenoate hydratase/2-oxohepta-3-ene-1,7-dioic acid hydratase in catechol pathway|nr:fumarylacetoacetate hydrolase family protein [Nitrososphaerota archaeon]MDG6946492.1 fumarylacetoacetate hydrolase family protein [Nitrososphaerota archaeon]MDG6947756.1 fumarylacetoacetate hydrolase family protein [Nitrososphaerota archaeon]
MRFCTFTLPIEGGRSRRAGLVADETIFEIEGARPLDQVIAEGRWRDVITKKTYGLSDVMLHAPVSRPGKILAAIVNTSGMLGGSDITLDRPRVDMKAPSTVVGPGTSIRAAPGGIRPEVELAAIVGRRISGATEAEAAASIFGYTILNDVTAPRDAREDAYEAYRRDRSTGEIKKTTMRGPLFRSKNHDTFCPMGPWVITPDEFDASKGHLMATLFNGQLVQEGSTSEYIFGPAKLVSYLSGFLTLEPGDVVSCGSVGWTKEAIGDLDPTEFVISPAGGTLQLEIEGLGSLNNPVAPALDP